MVVYGLARHPDHVGFWLAGPGLLCLASGAGEARDLLDCVVEFGERLFAVLDELGGMLALLAADDRYNQRGAKSAQCDERR